MSVGQEIFFPFHPERDQENGHMAVQKNLRELTQKFRKGTVTGQISYWDQVAGAWMVTSLILFDPATGDFKIVSGKLLFGADVNLYRSAANILKTDDGLEVVGQLILPTSGAGAGILLGGDTNLYRSAASELKTDDKLVVAGNAVIGPDVVISDELSVGGTLSVLGQLISDLTLDAAKSIKPETTHVAPWELSGSNFIRPPRMNTSDLPAPGASYKGATVWVEDIDMVAVCDGTVWALPHTHMQGHQNQAAFTTISASFVSTTETQVGRICYVDALMMHDAGWRPRIRINGFISCSSANVATAGIRIFEADVNDAGLTLIVTDEAQISEGAGAGVVEYEDSGWYTVTDTDTSPDPTAVSWYIVMSMRTSGGTATYNAMTIHCEWVKG
jgi:hypothetical protein